MMATESLHTTDNNLGSLQVTPEAAVSLRRIANVPLSELIADNKSLLVFPASIAAADDDTGFQPIFTLREGAHPKLHTGNIMGYVGVDDISLSIRSRFSKGDAGDFFLYHMLHRVFFPTVVNLPHKSQQDVALDILPFLFPRMLHIALCQGVYKEYKASNYNDSRVRGRIDVARHLRCNLPFTGKIAYRVRELAYDNNVTQLIRHTIEHIRLLPNGQHILGSTYTVKTDVNTIVNITPTYRRADLHTVVRGNALPVTHPYFSAYRTLQRLCLMILKGDKMRAGDTNKVYGILFDGAWLWEEYINSVIKPLGFVHPQNKLSAGRIHLFDHNGYPRYPDFLREGVVLDAKYKRLPPNAIPRDDMHQLIAYMHITRAETGGFVNPVEDGLGTSTIHPVGTLNGLGGKVLIASLRIPSEADTYKEFQRLITIEETNLTTQIASLISTLPL